MIDLGRMGVERMARLRDQMQAQGVDGAELLHGPNVGYATGHVPAAVDACHANHHRAVAIVGAADGPARLHAHDPAARLRPSAPGSDWKPGWSSASPTATAGMSWR